MDIFGVQRKLKKLKILFKNRSFVRNSFDQILQEHKFRQIIEKHKIKELTPILPVEFFSNLDHYRITDDVYLSTDFMNGSSPIIDYYFLCHIAKALKVKKYFEIGTWNGLSAFNISVNLGQDAKIYTLDLPINHPEIREYGIPEKIFGYHSKNQRNIVHLKGDSKIFDFTPYAGKMDLIFIDGNHSLDYVINDSKKAIDVLSHDRTVILWHDYILGENINNHVLCGILEAIPESKHDNLFYLYQSNMAVYCNFVKEIKNKVSKWQLPNDKFNIKLIPQV